EDVAVLDASRDSGLAPSPADRAGRRTFARTSEAQHAAIATLMREIPAMLPTLRSRRRVTGRRGDAVDVRNVYRRARRTGGEVIDLRWRHRPSRPRRILILIDVSGSMKQYSADYLRFAHTVTRCCERVEAFTFGTSLTQVTSVLRTRDVDDALAGLAETVLDIDGGTLIGASMQEFLSNGRRVTMARDALVLVLSDGLERGDCHAMAAATRRLSLLSHRLLWWTPLACDPSYEPVTRGMSAVVGMVDELAGVRDLGTAVTQVRRRAAGSGALAHDYREVQHA
ncbi:MAG: VWA domain-containing protein, partial [Nocardioidaceae bacterium]